MRPSSVRRRATETAQEQGSVQPKILSCAACKRSLAPKCALSSICGTRNSGVRSLSMEFNPKELLAQAQRASQEIQEKMRATVVEGSAGGGTVSVKMNGQKQVLSVKIDPEAVKSGDVEMLQDLITAAVNEAARKVDGAMQSSVGSMLGGMNLPGLF
ncbi:MAG: YbaB/EbfC family nucleoid-associated protein [Acidobacteria bacterium]|nr:YbaB/EbfC family nucleoid-associated protein [Acidobacteriota bacterium]